MATAATPDSSSDSTSARVILSARAYADILNETSQHLETETGGVFIGARDGGVWYVVESIDPGPRALLSHSYFEYDEGYVNHLANKVSRRYSSPMRLLGLWHRHPGGFDRFSSTDDQTHLRYIQQCKAPIISILVNIDPKFRLTCYVVDGAPVRHQPVSYVIGDDLLPDSLLRLLDHNALLQRIHSPSGTRAVASHTLEIVDRAPARRTSALPAAVSEETRPASQDAAEDVLTMLDSEMDFLESQHDFSYELEMLPSGLRLTMNPLSGGKTRQPLQFLFTTQNEKRVVMFESNSYDFQQGMIQKLVGARYY